MICGQSCDNCNNHEYKDPPITSKPRTAMVRWWSSTTHSSRYVSTQTPLWFFILDKYQLTLWPYFWYRPMWWCLGSVSAWWSTSSTGWQVHYLPPLLDGRCTSSTSSMWPSCLKLPHQTSFFHIHKRGHNLSENLELRNILRWAWEEANSERQRGKWRGGEGIQLTVDLKSGSEVKLGFYRSVI